MEFTIKRVSAEPQAAVFGVLLDNKNLPFAVTLERDWLENKKTLSCIPAGRYLCKRVQSPKFGNTFEITNVPNRSKILFHWGNIEANSEGCVLVAENYGVWKDGQISVENSKVGFNEFMKKLSKVDEFYLTIEWCTGKGYYRG